ncbi:MAG TPA: hypothetical protein VIY73_03770 [Polyangiaceae bacterium]
MVPRSRLAFVLFVACGALVACAGCTTSAESHPLVCAQFSPGQYTFSLTYDGESTFDGGCPSARPLDRETATLTLDGQGGGTLTTSMQTLACSAYPSGECNVVVQCDVPPSDQVDIMLWGVGTTFDAGLEASVQYLVDASGSAGGETSVCAQQYLVQ